MRERTPSEPERYEVERPAAPDHSKAPTLRDRLVARWPSLEFTLAGLDGPTAWVLIAAAILLVFYRKFGRSGYFEAVLRPETLRHHPYLSVYGDYYWFLACLFILGVVPWLIGLPRAVRPRYSGLGLGDWRFGLKWTVVLVGAMVPIVTLVSRWPTFWQYYPLNGVLATQAARWLAGLPGVPETFVLHFVVYELLYAVYFIGWEYFFRGFLVFGLYDRLGVHGVFVANVPFALLHFGKPFPEALGSILAGIALGLFALRARSFWYCFSVHALVAWTMDAAAILRRVQNLTGS